MSLILKFIEDNLRPRRERLLVALIEVPSLFDVTKLASFDKQLNFGGFLANIIETLNEQKLSLVVSDIVFLFLSLLLVLAVKQLEMTST